MSWLGCCILPGDKNLYECVQTTEISKPHIRIFYHTSSTKADMEVEDLMTVLTSVRLTSFYACPPLDSSQISWMILDSTNLWCQWNQVSQAAWIKHVANALKSSQIIHNGRYTTLWIMRVTRKTSIHTYQPLLFQLYGLHYERPWLQYWMHFSSHNTVCSLRKAHRAQIWHMITTVEKW